MHGATFLKNLGFGAVYFLYAYTLYKLYALNWFENADIPTLVFAIVVIAAFPILIFNLYKTISR